MAHDSKTDSREDGILKERAKKTAEASSVPAEGKSIHILAFIMGGETYGVEDRFISEVIARGCITPLPCVPPFIRGIINIRGKIMAVLDLMSVFGLSTTVTEESANIIILQTPENEFGILADRIGSLAAIPLSLIQGTLPGLCDTLAEYLKGVTSGGLVILDAEKMLADKKLSVNETVGRPK